jgi:hypothetical protein
MAGPSKSAIYSAKYSKFKDFHDHSKASQCTIAMVRCRRKSRCSAKTCILLSFDARFVWGWGFAIDTRFFSIDSPHLSAHWEVKKR